MLLKVKSILPTYDVLEVSLSQIGEIFLCLNKYQYYYYSYLVGLTVMET